MQILQCCSKMFTCEALCPCMINKQHEACRTAHSAQVDAWTILNIKNMCRQAPAYTARLRRTERGSYMREFAACWWISFL